MLCMALLRGGAAGERVVVIARWPGLVEVEPCSGRLRAGSLELPGAYFPQLSSWGKHKLS